MLALAGVAVAGPGSVLHAGAVSTAGPSAAAATWAAVTSPDPGSESNLAGVSCAAADCWAVGAEAGSGGLEVPLTEVNTGSGWTEVSSPVVGGTLDGVSCPTATACVAVGAQGSASRWGAPLAERYTTGGWAAVPTPATSSGNGDLAAVVCVTGSDCWAAGAQVTSSDGTVHAPLVEHYNGSAWSIAAAGSADGVLDGITCVTADDCWAAGYQVAAGNQTGLLEQFTGSGWNIVGSTGVAPVDGIACLTASRCWAVGQEVIEQGGSGPWTVASRPSGLLTGVSCVASLPECWAVGIGGTADVLVEQYAAGGWTQSAVSDPHPSGFKAAELEGVACAGSAECVAVGSTSETVSGGSSGQTLVEQYQVAPTSPTSAGTPSSTPTATLTPPAAASPTPAPSPTPSAGTTSGPLSIRTAQAAFPWPVVLVVVIVVLLVAAGGWLVVRRRASHR
jgi:hypothetical protein